MEDNLGIKIGRTIRQIRTNKHLSQEVVSSFASISRSNYANVERGRYENISITKLAKIASALDTPLYKIIEMAENENFNVNS